MDLKPVEAALVEIGKAFRLCRLYPITHPSVQQSLSELAALLPGVAALGTLELRIASTGFLIGAAPVSQRNPQLQELASLLYGQGHRSLVIEPGVSAEEFAQLIRMTASAGSRGSNTLGVQSKFTPLPHLRLEQSAKRTSTQAKQDGGMFAQSETPAMGRRTMQVFRPDAMPAEIEAARLVSLLDVAAPADASRHIGRLTELAADLLAQRDFATYARAIAAMARWSRNSEADAAPAAKVAQDGLAVAVTPPGLSALVGRLAETSVPPAERDGIVQALGAIGARAMAPVTEAFAAASPDHRDLLLAVVRLGGETAVAPILARLDPDVKGEHAKGLALMLGATRSAHASPGLVTLARHAEASVRSAALTSLARVPTPEAGRMVVAGLRDKEPQVRIAAARGVSWFGDASVVPILLANLANEEDGDVLKAIALALGELRDPRAINPLAELARGISGVFRRHPPPVRAAAVKALGNIGTEQALSVVATFLADRNPEIRTAAEEALA